jgi:uncharacterized protein
MPAKYLVATSFMLLPIAAFAQEGPSFDCAKAESSAEKLICEDEALADLDNRITRRFADALAVSKTEKPRLAEPEKLLRARQRGWIKGRDECWKEDDLRACVQRNYLQREAELVAEYELESPSESFTLKCGDETVNFTTYATALPALSAERDESLSVGFLLGTTGERRFAMRLGSFILNEDGGIWEDPYGNQTACKPLSE